MDPLGSHKIETPFRDDPLGYLATIVCGILVVGLIVLGFLWLAQNGVSQGVVGIIFATLILSLGTAMGRR